MGNLPLSGSGVLPNQHLETAIDIGVIHAGRYTIDKGNLQPASLDLRLGETAYRIRCSFLPGRATVADRMKDLVIAQFDLRGEGAVLETNRPYLIPLKEHLDLPKELRARANPKSSTGRADVFTRVITDHGARFDDIQAGYSGPLWLEVVPLSFPVFVREDLTLNQLRISAGHTQLTDEQIAAEHATAPLVYSDGRPVAPRDLGLAGGLFLSLNLHGDRHKRVGWRARANAPLLDLNRVGAVEPDQFWERVVREDGDRIVLTPKDFYLLMSYEAVTIPPMLAAEMMAYDPTSGELRTHYAGFFDPGFGYDPRGQLRGSTAALEVRAHDIPFMVEHGQHVCKLTFERMLEEPTMLYGGTGIGSNYQRQKETLGKHFRSQTRANALAGDCPPEGGNADQLDLLADT
jgi:dCTP deaminase